MHETILQNKLILNIDSGIRLMIRSHITTHIFRHPNTVQLKEEKKVVPNANENQWKQMTLNCLMMIIDSIPIRIADWIRLLDRTRPYSQSVEQLSWEADSLIVFLTFQWNSFFGICLPLISCLIVAGVIPRHAHVRNCTATHSAPDLSLRCDEKSEKPWRWVFCPVQHLCVIVLMWQLVLVDGENEGNTFQTTNEKLILKWSAYYQKIVHHFTMNNLILYMSARARALRLTV